MSDELRRELNVLATMRRRVVAESIIASVLSGAIMLVLWHADLVLPDTRVLAALGLGLLSWAMVRTVAGVAALLEEPCPACYAPFFGGLARAPIALPLPPTQCQNCHITLDGQRTTQRGSDPTTG